jgi:hypothetical protein
MRHQVGLLGQQHLDRGVDRQPESQVGQEQQRRPATTHTNLGFGERTMLVVKRSPVSSVAWAISVLS